MTMIEKDAVGIPSTLIAIFANVTTIAGLQMVNVIFTLIISILSIVYLVYKISNERKKNQGNGKS
jgi:hypothetical protein